MPLYTYMCRKCDVIQANLWLTVREVTDMDSGATLCPKCNKPMKRDYSAMQIGVITHCLDYTTSDINGIPVHVGTLKQERALCEAHGVRRVSSDEVHVSKIAPAPIEPLRDAFERKAHEMGVEL